MDDHQKLYKSNKNSLNESRKERAEETLIRRKIKRKENVFNHRNMVGTSNSINNMVNANECDVNQSDDDNLMLLAKKVSNSLDQKTQLLALKAIRKIICTNDDQKIKDVVSKNIVSSVIDCLSYDESLEIQCEALWIIINIASGSSEDTYMLIEEGAVQALYRCLISQNVNVRELTIWAFGNIVGDGPLFRDYVLQYDILSNVEVYINRNTSKAILNNIAWLLLNLCRFNNPPLPIETTQRILNIIQRIFSIQISEIEINLIWAICYICEIGEQEIQIILDAGFIPIVLRFLNSTSNSSIMAALRTIGNIVNGSNAQAQTIINHGVIELFPQFLSHTNREIQKQVISIILNITVGSLGPNQDAIDRYLMAPMIALLKENTLDVQKDIIHALRNIARYGDNKIILSIVNENAIPNLCKLLLCEEDEVIILILEVFEVLIERYCSELMEIPFIIEFCGGRQTLETLLLSDNLEVRHLSKKLFDKYFITENKYQVDMDFN